MNWTREYLNEIEISFVNNPTIDKAVLQKVLLDCIEEIRQLRGYNYTAQNIGRHIVIIDNTNDHPFNLGENCIIVEFEDFESSDSINGYEVISVSGGDSWFVRHGDYEFVKEDEGDNKNE